MRKPEILWSADSMAAACDVDRACLMKFVRLELVPQPIILRDEVLWRASDIRTWARALNTSDPAAAVAALWVKSQGEEAAAHGLDPGMIALCGEPRTAKGGRHHGL